MTGTLSDPKILHISAWPSRPESEHKWFLVNVVIQVYEKEDICVCDAYCQDFCRNLLYEVEDPELIHLHYLHTTHFSKKVEGTNLSELISTHDPEYDISDRIHKGWTNNPEQFLTRTKKPGVYMFKQYVEDNLVTRAAIKMLHDIKEGEPNTSRFVIFSAIKRCLSALETFWD